MLYTIRHITRFNYEAPISESVMEVRMQPRTDHGQRCVHFGLSTLPASRVLTYQDHEGNSVHHFDIAARHTRLTITTETRVECDPTVPWPDQLHASAWAQLDATVAAGELWDTLAPSHFARPTPLLGELSRAIGLERLRDPLTTLRWLTTELFQRFEYRPQSTRVDSPIDDALGTRQGVCQDFAHIMIALARGLGIPARYVSGYLFQRPETSDRSSDGATHAWMEALLPGLGWVGFDPTNNLLTGDRHIRVAIGRDYADVPPTRGVFKGVSAVRSELAVSVSVASAQPVLAGDVPPFVPWMSREASAPLASDDGGQQ
jgi:transglutaminase-like putative cysteine protease